MSHTISSPTNTFDATVRAIRVAAASIAEGNDELGAHWTSVAHQRNESREGKSYTVSPLAHAENLAAAARAAANDLHEFEQYVAENVARGIEHGARARARELRARR